VSEHEKLGNATTDPIRYERFKFDGHYIAYEGDPLPCDAREFVDFGRDFVSKTLPATLYLAGYPAVVYQCHHAERTGHRTAQEAFCSQTTVLGARCTVVVEFPIFGHNEIAEVESAYAPSAGWALIDQWRRFGPNGRQVVALIDWLREFNLLEQARIVQTLNRRARPRQPLPVTPRYGVRALPIQISWYPWRHGIRLARAWRTALEVAAKSGMWAPTWYVSEAGPGLVAMVLRPFLRPRIFKELYADMEDSYPISTIDAEIEPVGFKERASPTTI
jgi:hypothetical protein